MIRTAIRKILKRLHLLAPLRRAFRRASPHGHGLLISLLPQVPASRRDGYLVEIGSTREKIPNQGSTVLLAGLADSLGIPFVTVDMDPENTEQARRDLAGYPKAQAVNAKGEDFLAAFDGPIVAAYLDAFDIDHGLHSPYRRERYQRFLSTEITDEACQQMHLLCAQALIPRVVPGGLVVIDDTWSARGRLVGKGATAVPHLESHGFAVVAQTATAVALQRLADR